MSQGHWVRITSTGNIPPREGRTVVVGDRELALFNLGDRFLAVDNRCPHQGGPLCDGIVTGSSVVCPLHAWKVNLQTGAVERPVVASESHCVETYTTRLEGEVVLVHLPAAPATTAGEESRQEGRRQGRKQSRKREGEAA
jgi:nitrite reductase (NADH) small subunit